MLWGKKWLTYYVTTDATLVYKRHTPVTQYSVPSTESLPCMLQVHARV